MNNHQNPPKEEKKGKITIREFSFFFAMLNIFVVATAICLIIIKSRNEKAIQENEKVEQETREETLELVKEKAAVLEFFFRDDLNMNVKTRVKVLEKVKEGFTGIGEGNVKKTVFKTRKERFKKMKKNLEENLTEEEELNSYLVGEVESIVVEKDYFVENQLGKLGELFGVEVEEKKEKKPEKDKDNENLARLKASCIKEIEKAWQEIGGGENGTGEVNGKSLNQFLETGDRDFRDVIDTSRTERGVSQTKEEILEKISRLKQEQEESTKTSEITPSETENGLDKFFRFFSELDRREDEDFVSWMIEIKSREIENFNDPVWVKQRIDSGELNLNELKQEFQRQEREQKEQQEQVEEKSTEITPSETEKGEQV